MNSKLASDTEIAELTETITNEAQRDESLVLALLARYPDDPRLHFLSGSILAGKGRPIEAHGAMSQALALSPGFTLARYQLGFFEMTSGEPARALATWGPLMALPADDYFRVFAEGMTHLIRDEFAAAIEKFQAGIALNRDNVPMNRDVHLLIAECRKLQGAADSVADDHVSATALLLGRFGGNRTLQ